MDFILDRNRTPALKWEGTQTPCSETLKGLFHHPWLQVCDIPVYSRVSRLGSGWLGWWCSGLRPQPSLAGSRDRCLGRGGKPFWSWAGEGPWVPSLGRSLKAGSICRQSFLSEVVRCLVCGGRRGRACLSESVWTSPWSSQAWRVPVGRRWCAGPRAQAAENPVWLLSRGLERPKPLMSQGAGG